MENNDVIFIKNFLEKDVSDNYFSEIMKSVTWHKELKSIIDGTTVKINRKMAYISDNPIIYKYANLELTGDVWNDTLLSIKKEIEDRTTYKFNSVLLNLYENGKEEIRWHSDKEEQLGKNPVIVSLNLGAGRTFHMKRKSDGYDIQYFMENGDLLIMLENCQENWLHAILKEKEVKDQRISLTFRWVYV